MPNYYDGHPLDTANTALSTDSPAPAVRWLVEKRHLVKGMRVLDYGAGKGRNARWLRDEGIHVYAYDPSHGSVDVGGWYDVSMSLPSCEDEFDVFLSCFVLNVVPKHVEESIIQFGNTYNTLQMHITRNHDLLSYVQSALYKGTPTVTDWFRNVYGGNPDNILTMSSIDFHMFCEFGVKTSKGFQRDVHLRQDQGWGIEHQAHGYRIFMQH